MRRGAAVVELALLLPIFATLAAFSIYLSELLRAKSKLQEQTRLVAWGGASPDVHVRDESAPATAGVLPSYRLDSRGQRRADAKSRFTSEALPLPARDLHEHLTLIATDWHIDDGSDAVMGSAREHPLRAQVRRMVFAGMPRPSVPTLGFAAPDPWGTYVVAKNYGLGRRSHCDQDPSHPARDGMSNLDRDSHLDWDRRKCFDTAPFRDQADYSGSLYVQLLLARGAYFMGCKKPQAEDPTTCQ